MSQRQREHRYALDIGKAIVLDMLEESDPWGWWYLTQPLGKTKSKRPPAATAAEVAPRRKAGKKRNEQNTDTELRDQGQAVDFTG